MFNISSSIFFIGMLLLIINTIRFFQKKDFINRDKLTIGGSFMASLVLITIAWVIKDKENNSYGELYGGGHGGGGHGRGGGYSGYGDYGDYGYNDYDYYSQFDTGGKIVNGTVYASEEGQSEAGPGLGWGL
jgi:hypothetical protein